MNEQRDEPWSVPRKLSAELRKAIEDFAEAHRQTAARQESAERVDVDTGEQVEVPFKDQGGRVVGKVVSWTFDQKTQSFSFTAELEDGTRLKGKA